MSLLTTPKVFFKPLERLEAGPVIMPGVNYQRLRLEASVSSQSKDLKQSDATYIVGTVNYKQRTDSADSISRTVHSDLCT